MIYHRGFAPLLIILIIAAILLGGGGALYLQKITSSSAPQTETVATSSLPTASSMATSSAAEASAVTRKPWKLFNEHGYEIQIPPDSVPYNDFERGSQSSVTFYSSSFPQGGFAVQTVSADSGGCTSDYPDATTTIIRGQTFLKSRSSAYNGMTTAALAYDYCLTKGSERYVLTPYIQFSTHTGTSPSKTELDANPAFVRMLNSFALSKTSIGVLPLGLFSSPSFGITFEYDPRSMLVEDDGTTLYIDEKGDRSPHRGDILQVFPKAASDSLADGIRKAVYGGTLPSVCTVHPDSGNWPFMGAVGASVYDASPDPFETETLCKGYQDVGSPASFFMDPDHPDKFYFIRTGSAFPFIWPSTIEPNT